MNLPALLAIGALGLVVIMTIAVLLVQLGCYLTGAEVPSIGSTLIVLLVFMVVGFFMNLTIAGVVPTLAAAVGGFDLSDRAVRADRAVLWQLKWIVRGIQFLVDIPLFAAIASYRINKLTFPRGLVVGFMLSVGMVGLGFFAAVLTAGIASAQR